MMRLFYVIGACAWLAAGVVLTRTTTQCRCGDPELDELRSRPGVMEVFQQQEDQRARDAEAVTSPLLTQAGTLADYLDPPVPVMAEGAAEPNAGEIGLPSLAKEPVSPKAASAAFRVVAVSCYPQRPERSMALIEPTIGGDAKWVKEGTPVGHFVVHEIRQGLVVLRNGEQRCELTVERNHVERSLVRDVRPGSRQVSAAGLDGTLMPETRSETDR